MVIAFSATQTSDGLRPVDVGRDMRQIVELLRMVFGESLDGDDRQLMGDVGLSGVNQIFDRLNPVAARLMNGFVWQADGRIVGNATLLPTKLWDRYLVANVAVHPGFRRRGIARALMEAITDSVKSKGGHVILLQVVKENQPAIDLYHSLGYKAIGNMTTWHATASSIRPPAPPPGAGEPRIEPLGGRRWREAYDLDTACVHGDLNWPEPLRPDAYRRTIWQRADDFLNGRQVETWSTTDKQGHLAALAVIYSEWGRSHLVRLRVRPDLSETLSRPVLAKVLRRLAYLPRRNVRIDHPEADLLMSHLLKEANFSVQRTLTHMRLDLT